MAKNYLLFYLYGKKLQPFLYFSSENFLENTIKFIEILYFLIFDIFAIDSSFLNFLKLKILLFVREFLEGLVQSFY
jgi:hypothetical protein